MKYLRNSNKHEKLKFGENVLKIMRYPLHIYL